MDTTTSPSAVERYPATLSVDVEYGENGDLGLNFTAKDKGGRATLQDLRERFRWSHGDAHVHEGNLKRNSDGEIEWLRLVIPRKS